MAVETRVLRVLNTTACPTTDPTPDPQFAGARICTDAAPRYYAGTQSRKQDQNVNSPTYGQWLKADDTYTASESDGDYFVTGETDTALCPLVDTLVPQDITATTTQLSFRIVRGYEPLSPNNGGVSVDFDIYKVVGGALIGTGIITITGSNLQSAIESFGISGVSSGDSIRIHFVSVVPNVYQYPENTTTSVT